MKYRNLCTSATEAAKFRIVLSKENLTSAFFQTNGLTGSLTEEVKLRTTNDGTSFDFDLVDTRRMNWELTFDTFTSNNATHDEHFASAGTALGDHGTRENLDSFFVTFLDLRVDIDCVPNSERIHFLLQGRLFNQLEQSLAHVSKTTK